MQAYIQFQNSTDKYQINHNTTASNIIVYTIHCSSALLHICNRLALTIVSKATDTKFQKQKILCKLQDIHQNFLVQNCFLIIQYVHSYSQLWVYITFSTEELNNLLPTYNVTKVNHIITTSYHKQFYNSYVFISHCSFAQ